MVIDVALWLRRLGLEQYAPGFADNDIDAAVLPELTAEDLIALRVTSVGHRRRLLSAIATLRDQPPEVVSPAPAATATIEAERRQLTVMFCDLVGSTALSTRFDPEDLREVIGAYHRCVTEIVEGLGGFVARYMGDGVLVYFGYPQAHEDDAERATRCGLAMVDRVSQLNLAEELHVRVGIATGLVVVGGEVVEHDVVGETPNLAARLQALAEPDTVVIAASTRRLVGDLFEYRDLGAVQVKGLPAAVRAFRVVRVSKVGSRFEALRTGETPLVGREEEMQLLGRRWAQAKAGRGQIVLISAEPGIGKSRLAETFRQSLEGGPQTRLRYFCSPHHQDSALFPFIAQLERTASFERDDTPAVRLDKLEGLVAAKTPEDGDVQFLAELVSVPFDGRYPALELTPQRKKEKTFQAHLRQLKSLAHRQPVLIIFEDLHWADPSSRELLDLTVEQIARMPVLLIATFRPEFQPPWIGQPHVTAMSLRRLARDESEELVRGLVGSSVAVSSELVDDIIERTDGVPLYLEELTKAVLEGAIAASQISAVPRTSSTVPATLHASLMARLDRLGPAAKEIAQIGAAIGREFSYRLLTAVAQQNEIKLQAALGRLVEAGLVFQRSGLPHATFLFKHALVTDTAYGTLLRGRRQFLHSRIADALLSTTGEEPAAAPEIIALHLQNAGRLAEAIVYWRNAGEQAVRRAANREAIEHLRRTLSLLEAQPETAERWRAELAVLSQLSPALISVHGRSAPEAGEAIERAVEVGRRLDSSADLAPSIANLWFFTMARGRIDRADEISADLFNMARELNDAEILLQAHHTAWSGQWIRGLFAEASNHINEGIALYSEERHAHHRYVYLGHDPSVCGLGIGAIVQWALGYPVRSMQLEGEAVALGRRLRHAPSLTHALWFTCDAQAERGDAASVMDTATQLLRLSEEHGFFHHRANASVFLGWALACSGEVAEGIARLEEGIGALVKMGAQVNLTRSLCLMAEAHLSARHYAKGFDQVAKALEIASKTGEEWYVSRLYRVRAELQLRANSADGEAVEMNLRNALSVARQQGGKGLELRAGISLARRWLDSERHDDARNLLAPIYGWFTEGFDTPDLKEAKALLDELQCVVS
jgi:class 3 adenylate cyclase/predicted ATPase